MLNEGRNVADFVLELVNELQQGRHVASRRALEGVRGTDTVRTDENIESGRPRRQGEDVSSCTRSTEA